MDWIMGVDFVSPVSRDDAGTANAEGSLYYASSAFVPILNTALRWLNIKSTDAILDYGSGKGAAMVKFSNYPFCKIAGVELSSKLLLISRKNFKALNLKHLTLIEGDATNFREIGFYNYFYFANPFNGNAFISVIENIVESVIVSPRKVRIIYYHPKCHDVIMNTGKFIVLKEFVDGARRILIYEMTV